jgi:hypothetical protein
VPPLAVAFAAAPFAPTSPHLRRRLLKLAPLSQARAARQLVAFWAAPSANYADDTWFEDHIYNTVVALRLRHLP